MFAIIEGDRHIQSKKPFYEAHLAYNEWLLNQDWNNSDTVFFSQGDFFNKSNPDPWEYAIAVDFIERAKFSKIYIQAGNHEYSRPTDRYALHPLERFDNVDVLYEETQLEWENTKVLSLPFYYPNTRPDVGRMEDYYSRIHEYEIGKGHFDYVFGHLYFVNTYGSFVDVTRIDADHKIFGHDHSQFANSEGEYMGTPMPHRFSEKGQQGRLLRIDCSQAKGEYIDIPRLLDYETVTYPNPLPEVESEYTIWDVEEAVDKQVAIEFYRKQDPKFVYRDIRKQKSESSSTNEKTDSDAVWSIKDWLEKFLEDEEKSDEVKRIVREKLEA